MSSSRDVPYSTAPVALFRKRLGAEAGKLAGFLDRLLEGKLPAAPHLGVLEAAAKLLSERDLRDLVEFLAGLKR